MRDRREADIARHNLRHKLEPTRRAPSRQPDTQQHDGEDQGIRNDERGQIQPADQERASQNR
jgi:hypothetical protein